MSTRHHFLVGSAFALALAASAGCNPPGSSKAAQSARVDQLMYEI